MSTKTPTVLARRRRLRTQAGFTLMETLVALAIFAISIVGLVAMEGRAIEAQRASAEIRDAERIAQEVMAEMTSRGYLELIQQDFEGTPNPSFPYDDAPIAAAQRTRDFRRPPADIPMTDDVVGSLRGQYLVQRTVDWVIDPANPPNDPPILGADEGLIHALTLEVVVLWLDYSNPSYPPPAGLATTDLTPAMIEPGDPQYRPYVSNVRLRTVRVNDAVTGGP